MGGPKKKSWRRADMRTGADWVAFTDSIDKACKQNDRKLKKARKLLGELVKATKPKNDNGYLKCSICGASGFLEDGIEHKDTCEWKQADALLGKKEPGGDD